MKKLFVLLTLTLFSASSNQVLAQAGGPPLGTWVLDRVTPAPSEAPQSPTVRTFQDWGGGVVYVTNDGIDAEGNRQGNRIAFRRDGRDYPLAAMNQPGYVTISFVVTSRNPWVADYAIKVDGNVIQNSTESVSRNGRTMTIEIRGPDPDGPVTQTEVWQKQ